MKSITTPVIVTVALIVAGVAYWYFFTGTGNEPPLSTDATSTQAQIQFETLVGELQPISFNTKIFSDPRFNALVDITTAIAAESSGRLDPLAPLSGASAAPAPVYTPTPVAPVSAPASSTPPIPIQ